MLLVRVVDAVLVSDAVPEAVDASVVDAVMAGVTDMEGLLESEPVPDAEAVADTEGVTLVLVSSEPLGEPLTDAVPVGDGKLVLNAVGLVDPAELGGSVDEMDGEPLELAVKDCDVVAVLDAELETEFVAVVEPELLKDTLPLWLIVAL